VNTDLGLIFDEDPELYARARQPYPAALFRELDALAGPLAGARVVEIGPGTGQATVGLVAAGAQVTAVEPGTGMAGVLRRTCPTVDVAVTPFEQWAGSSGVWDVVVAFTCWHWPDFRRSSGVWGHRRCEGAGQRVAAWGDSRFRLGAHVGVKHGDTLR